MPNITVVHFLTPRPGCTSRRGTSFHSVSGVSDFVFSSSHFLFCSGRARRHCSLPTLSRSMRYSESSRAQPLEQHIEHVQRHRSKRQSDFFAMVPTLSSKPMMQRCFLCSIRSTFVIVVHWGAVDLSPPTSCSRIIMVGVSSDDTRYES